MLVWVCVCLWVCASVFLYFKERRLVRIATKLETTLKTFTCVGVWHVHFVCAWEATLPLCWTTQVRRQDVPVTGEDVFMLHSERTPTAQGSNAIIHYHRSLHRYTHRERRMFGGFLLLVLFQTFPFTARHRLHT